MEKKPWEWKAIPTVIFLETVTIFVDLLSCIWPLCSDPLASVAVTVCTISLLYFPGHLLGIVFSPVPIMTWTLLMIILRHGAAQRVEKESNSQSRTVPAEPEPPEPIKPPCLEPFDEWDVRAPLDIIYEEYEEGDHEGQDDDISDGGGGSGESRPPSLSRCYPGSESDISSRGWSPASHRWDWVDRACYAAYVLDAEDGEGLVEIALDGGGAWRRALELQLEEENLIEIDISPGRIWLD